MEDFNCKSYYFRTKTPISSEVIAQIDAHYDGGLTKWKERYRPLIIRQRKNIEFLHIAVTQLYETAQQGHGDALDILGEVIGCTRSRPCYQILCPACRDKRQKDTADKAVAAFANYPDENIKFMTLLIRVRQDANELPPLIKEFRRKFWNRLSNNAKSLSTPAQPFKMIGAFEIDLKNMGTQWDASLKSRELVKQLGYNPRAVQRSLLNLMENMDLRPPSAAA